MIIGIDLGTTNSLVAFWDKTQPRIIPNCLGDHLTPSAVYVDDSGEIHIGKVAKERLITDPLNTAVSFKRFMGTKKEYRLGKYVFSAMDLSSFILKSLKADAEEYLGEPVKNAIISVPAYFNDTQRKATKQAAELASLTVDRLVTEPTAAALAYGLNSANDYKRFLVFDLGGGTFDVSLLEHFEGVMEVRAIAGDNYLGGDDFTSILTSYFLDKNKLKPNEIDPKQMALINKQIESVKHKLSDMESVDVDIRIEEALYNFALTRNKADILFDPLYKRLREPIERVLRDASFSPEELDAVVMVGGATRMAGVRNLAAKILGRIPYYGLNPDENIALGAAVQAGLVSRDEALKERMMTDVCPYTLGVDVCSVDEQGRIIESNVFSPIIERNTIVPVSRTQRYASLRYGQSELEFNVYQGESRNVMNNIKLGELKVPIPDNGIERQCADVRFTYDVNGLLEVEVVVPSTGHVSKLIIEKSPGTMTKQEISQRLQELASIKIHPRDKTTYRLLLARGERLFEEHIGLRRETLGQAIARLSAVLESQDESRIRKVASEVKDHFDQIEFGEGL